MSLHLPTERRGPTQHPVQRERGGGEGGEGGRGRERQRDRERETERERERERERGREGERERERERDINVNKCSLYLPLQDLPESAVRWRCLKIAALEVETRATLAYPHSGRPEINRTKTTACKLAQQSYPLTAKVFVFVNSLSYAF